MPSIPPLGPRSYRTIGPFAVALLLLVSALLVGLAAPEAASPANGAPRPYVHTHADGSVWWHDPATGATRNLTISRAPSIEPLAGVPFSFGVAGDYGFSGDAQSVMTAMGDAGLDFVIGLGDLSYGDTSESNWCNFFESKVGAGRVLIIAGNHDSGESSGGNINTFRQHCDFGIDAALTGDYGKEYYFDYPRTDPLMRLIGTGCGLNWAVDGGGYWSCTEGSPHYNFIRDAIDGARAAGIPWITVYSHKPCINSHSYGCDLGQAVLDLLTSRRVDLLLSGHAHNYQRSKQLSCATHNDYRPECVTHAEAPYVHGDGTVVQIVGTGGRSLYPIQDNADRPYFAVANSDSKGFAKYSVSAGALQMEYVRAVGSLVESYDVQGSGTNPDFSMDANPTGVTFEAGQSATSTVTVSAVDGFTGTVSLTGSSAPSGVSTSCVPSSLAGSGTSTCTMTASSAGSHTVTITGTSGGLVHSATVGVTVTAPGSPGPTDTTPPVIAIGSPSNRTTFTSPSVTVTGSASDDSAVEVVELRTDGTSWTPTSGTTAWSATISLAPGEHRIYARATDTAGNSAIVVITVYVQSNPAVPVGPPGQDPTPSTPLALGSLIIAGLAVLPAALLSGLLLLRSQLWPGRVRGAHRSREGPSAPHDRR